MTTPIVVHANLFLALAVPLPHSKRTEVLFRVWERSQPLLYAPSVWEYQIAAGLHRACELKYLTADQGSAALRELQAFKLKIVEPDAALLERAFRWASRLSSDYSYDAHYLALAETLGAECWTADLRLVQWLRVMGTNWVHCVSD